MLIVYPPPLRELLRLHQQVYGAKLETWPWLEHQKPDSVGLHAFVGQRRVCDSAAQLC
jgi:hypothetical protein